MIQDGYLSWFKLVECCHTLFKDGEHLIRGDKQLIIVGKKLIKAGNNLIKVGKNLIIKADNLQPKLPRFDAVVDLLKYAYHCLLFSFCIVKNCKQCCFFAFWCDNLQPTILLSSSHL